MIQTPPLARSFSTICPRLTRKTGWLSLAFGTFWATAGWPSHERAYTLLAPPQAAWTHAPSTTGRAGVPAPFVNRVVALPPLRGTRIRADELATYTAGASGPAC